MLAASACRSSDSSGDEDTTCWKLLLMLRWSASISRPITRRAAPRRRAVALQVRTGLSDAIETDAGQALHDQPQAAVRQLEHLVHVRGRADRIEVLLDRLLDRGLALGEHADHPPGSGGHR